MSTISQYESHAGDGDQKTSKTQDNTDRFDQGKEHAHTLNDPKDERGLANRAEQEKKNEKLEKEAEEARKNADPTAAALSHGNEPSKGAKIDKQIQEEEDQLLRDKGIKK